MKTKSFFLMFFVLFIFGGCQKDATVSEFNKSALYWYEKIAKSIDDSNIDKADNYYVSLKSEHIQSPLMKTSMMMLANAHMQHEEYKLANFYFEEYEKRYGDSYNKHYIEFMKLKASFLGIKDAYKDQQLIIDSIDKASSYLQHYPDSSYTPLVSSILIRLYMSQYMLNDNIVALYERIGKPKAAQIYRDKNKNSIIKMSDIKVPPKTILGKILD